MDSFPVIETISAERQRDAAYHHAGRYRANESHCIFKYSLRGEGIFRDGQGEHRVPAGTGFLCRIADPETAYYYPPDGHSPWDFVYAAFSGGPVNSMVQDLTSRFGPLYPLDPESAAIQHLLQQHRRRIFESELLPGQSASFVTTLLSALADSKRTNRDDPGSLLVKRTQAFIRENINKNLNVSVLSLEMRVSREHLSRVFAHQTGGQLYRYLVRQKMVEAARLLKESDLSAKEVSRRLGYQEPAHFSRLFKTAFQLTPGQFRRHGSLPLH